MKFVNYLNSKRNRQSPKEILQFIIEEFEDKAVFTSSFSIEDQVITQLINELENKIKIVTLDTGRLPEETYNLMERTKEFYGINIHAFFPNNTSVEEMVNKHGHNLFYKSIELRKMCCNVRKVIPLQRALTNYKVWITGLRKEQSVTRESFQTAEYDDNFKIIKVNPLIDWTEKEVWNYINSHNIPYNILYKKNYTSIGCAPCTRPVKIGETIRDGRWWWENSYTKECGLHSKTN